jgi:6-phosphogluconolactonase
MRMKLNRFGQLGLAAAASLIAAGTVTACATLTVDFVYVTSSKAAGANNYGNVDVFEVNSESGRLRQIPTSPFPSGGRDPVAEAVSPNFANLYVVNQDDNNIVQFAIGNDGKLYPQNTINTPGIFPLAIAINGSLLFVADTYQPLPTCSPAEPCAGSVAVFPLSSSGQPGTAVSNPNGDINYWPLTAPHCPTNVITPSAISAVHSGKYVFVAAYDTTAAANDTASSPVSNGCDTNGAGTAPTGYVFAFAAASNGVLTPVSGSPFVVEASGANGIGVQPSAMASDPGSDHLYVADFSGGKIYGYSVGSGTLEQLSRSPYGAGNQPAAITVDSAGEHAYVANSLDNTISAYTITDGVLSAFGTYPTSTQPVAIMVDPATDHFVYAANYLGSSVSGYQLLTSGGTSLVITQQTPYVANAQTTAMVGIPHGTQAAQ